MSKWPNFFVVGAPRSGTTSLWEYLRKHPKIFMPVKELQYFSYDVVSDQHRLIKNEEDYLKLYESVKDEIVVGDVSATYLMSPKSPKLIHNVSPDAKIVMILRDPVDRAYSEFGMAFEVNQKISFRDFIEKNLKESQGNTLTFQNVIQVGLYYKQVKRYIEMFGKEQIKIIIFEHEPGARALPTARGAGSRARWNARPATAHRRLDS